MPDVDLTDVAIEARGDEVEVQVVVGAPGLTRGPGGLMARRVFALRL